eukprot:TRINITY_DN10957_c0_g4_i1.p1 TRINITY_DN10957_c0_g4~~TRINITY_DN10957_c0_g4_i1.p1  ORF type:complete len:579 (+),score=120.00 TRINITY_DN10957_c0_g4_i1:166-1737(+)
MVAVSIKRLYAGVACASLQQAQAEGSSVSSSAALQELAEIPLSMGQQMERALAVWRRWRKLQGHAHVGSELLYRVTCSRGGKHVFSTDEAAKSLAEGLQKLNPAWEACLVDFSLEVMAHVHFSEVSLSLSLTEGGKMRLKRLNEQRAANAPTDAMPMRGATTLSPDLSYGLLVAAKLGTWNMLVDPMCGSNAIAETALRVGAKFCLVGDFAAVAIEKTAHNAKLLPPALRNRLDIVRWDCRRLPLRDGVVETLVTDMPFGKRIGSASRVNHLYPPVLAEFLRVSQLRRGQPNGTVVLLTQMTALVRRELRTVLPLHVKNHWGEDVGKGWANQRMHGVNHGGLDCHVFILKPRSAICGRQRGGAPKVPAERNSEAREIDAAIICDTACNGSNNNGNSNSNNSNNSSNGNGNNYNSNKGNSNSSNDKTANIKKKNASQQQQKQQQRQNGHASKTANRDNNSNSSNNNDNNSNNKSSNNSNNNNNDVAESICKSSNDDSKTKSLLCRSSAHEIGCLGSCFSYFRRS